MRISQREKGRRKIKRERDASNLRNERERGTIE